MTFTTDILQQLRRDWDYRSRSRDSRRAVRLLDEAHPELSLRDVEDMGGVLGLLETRSGRCVLEKARILQALLIESDDEFLRRALLQTLLPGIVSTCRQFRFGDGIIDDPSETLGVAIALCAELLVEWAGQSRPYAGPDLLSALRGRLRRWLLKEKALLQTTAPYNDEERAGEGGTSLETRLALVAVHEPRLAQLAYARIFDETSLKALAHADQSSVGTLRLELERFALRELL
jgi:hypothetical protein